MPSRGHLVSMFFLLFAAVFCDGQTATRTNWKFFNLPSPFTSTNPRGINRWGTVVGDAEGTNLSNPVGFIRYSNGTVKTYAVSNGVRTFFTRRNAQGVTIGWADSPLGTDGLVSYLRLQRRESKLSRRNRHHIARNQLLGNYRGDLE